MFTTQVINNAGFLLWVSEHYLRVYKSFIQLQNWLIIKVVHTANHLWVEVQCFYKNTHPLGGEREA